MKFKDGMIIVMVITIVILFSKVVELRNVNHTQHTILSEVSEELKIADRGNIILQAKIERTEDIAEEVKKALRTSKKQDDHVDSEILDKLDIIISEVE